MVFALAAGCVRADLVNCENGSSCPNGTACDDVHGGCVDPAQLSACGGAEQLAACSAAEIEGACFDGVCLPLGCGNRIVEPGEACDDGNLVSGDGCRTDCLSNETCGNGTVDLGEICDDGNLLSRDDCDSRCLRETVRTRIVPLSLPIGSLGECDATQPQLLAPRAPGATWSFDGARWELTLTATPAVARLVYDSDRHLVVGVAYDSAWGWNGATWTQLAATGPVGNIAAAVYDRARQRTLVLVAAGNFINLWQLDAAGTWTSSLLGTGRIIRASGAIDPQTGEIVFTTSYFDSASVWVFDGTTWTQTADSLFGYARLFEYRGELRTVLGQAMYARRHGAWVAVPEEDLPTSRPCVYHDVARDELIATDGQATMALSATGWVERPLLPRPNTRAALAVGTSFDILDVPSSFGVEPMRSWRIDPDAETFERITLPGAPLARESFAYGPSLARGGGVLVNGFIFCNDCPATALEDSQLFDGAGWTQIENTADLANNGGYAVAYDPTQRSLVVDNSSTTLWRLDDDATAWVPARTTNRSMTQLTWDFVGARLVGRAGAKMFDLTETAWVESDLYPGGQQYITNDERTGAILSVVDIAGARVLWERRGGSWTRLDTLPPEFSVLGDAYRSRDGTLLLFGSISGNGSIAIFRDRTSPTPLETCEEAVDTDGDGLAFCDDPDCYWRCSRCPPHSTCRYDLSP